ncbi:low affinity immunoglobulin epsilon Fc receptor-like [Amphibalanus amphitrite]|uniref:low affinity immunoglobulin epsilon Fc receptor-like n=1 Tax=Amphibalanus amphitrite TaxID=1232801 RepID=UPI001C9113DC|nr:low affinity immunoglobulin epsilon Fc receptor-like [Amphibalanus amphitrite]
MAALVSALLCCASVVLLHLITMADVSSAAALSPAQPTVTAPPSSSAEPSSTSAAESPRNGSSDEKRQHDWDKVLNMFFDLVTNSSSAASRHHFAELKKQLSDLSTGLHQDSQLSAHSSEAIGRLLAGFEGLQQQIQELQTEQSGVQSEMDELRSSVAQIRDVVTQMMPLLVSVHRQVLLSCPDNWSRHGASCFLAPAQSVTWHDANRTCVQKDRRAQLASIHEDNADFIHQLLRETQGSNFWIGLRRSSEDPGWAWTDGSPLDHTAWRAGEPNNVEGEENCVHVNKRSHGLQDWNDIECSRQMKYLCQITTRQHKTPW